jgi:GPH family glycoside/pentoside/hexuronide:cation symporter
LWAMIADVADYSEWTNNRRATAIIFSAMIFGLKFGLSVGGAISTWLLGTFGYVADAPAQTDGATNGIKLLVSVIPALIFIAGAALLFWYPIGKQMELKIESELKERKKNL